MYASYLEIANIEYKYKRTTKHHYIKEIHSLKDQEKEKESNWSFREQKKILNLCTPFLVLKEKWEDMVFIK